jgi:hypothetical protein
LPVGVFLVANSPWRQYDGILYCFCGNVAAGNRGLARGDFGQARADHFADSKRLEARVETRVEYDSMRNTTVQFFILCACLAGHVAGEEVALNPSKDNSIFSESGTLSDGKGIYLFAGMTNRGDARRALLAFDVSGAIPSGAIVTSAVLKLNMSKTIAGSTGVSLHRMLADWGEGTSDASANEGRGASAKTNDATWDYSFFDSQSWQAAGGDFVSDVSAVTTVANNGSYSWSSEQLTADVQAWLDEPSTNFGWILIGEESRSPTAKRFDSNQTTTASRKPSLQIIFERSLLAGDFDLDGILSFKDVDLLSAQVAAASGDLAFDLNGDQLVSGLDVNKLLASAGRINGDADFDGSVQFPDFVVLANNFTQTNKKWSEGDFDSNGEVQFPDFTILANNFGKSAAQAVAVPEPASSVLAILGGWLMTCWRLRRVTQKV